MYKTPVPLRDETTALFFRSIVCLKCHLKAINVETYSLCPSLQYTWIAITCTIAQFLNCRNYKLLEGKSNSKSTLHLVSLFENLSGEISIKRLQAHCGSDRIPQGQVTSTEMFNGVEKLEGKLSRHSKR